MKRHITVKNISCNKAHTCTLIFVKQLKLKKIIRFVLKEALNTDFYIVIILCEISEYVNVAQK